MRRQLAFLICATTSLVLLAFLVPLGFLVQRTTAERAVDSATREATTLAPVVATVNRGVLGVIVTQAARDDIEGFQLSVFLPDGTSTG